MLVNEDTTVALIFTDEAGNKTEYDCSNPENCFSVFLEKFLEAKKSGQFKNQPDQKTIKEIVGLLDEDCYQAGKAAFLFARRTNCFNFHFKRLKEGRG